MDSDQRLSTDEILTQFSNPELASHAYLDLYFQKWTPLKQLSELHSQSSQLLSQLDHATEDLTWQLEDIMTELKKSGPRLTYQVELLKSGVAGLVADIEDIAAPKIQEIKQRREEEAAEEREAEKASTSTDEQRSGENPTFKTNDPTESKEQTVSSNPTIARLQQLETVRTRMKQVEAVLQRVQSFDEVELTNGITLLIENDDLEGALRRVEDAAEIIQVWKGTSLYNGRAKFVAQLRKRIEAALGQKELLENQNANTRAGANSPQINDRSGKWYKGSSSRTNSNSPASSRPGTPKAQEADGYYGLFGQLSKKIGY